MKTRVLEPGVHPGRVPDDIPASEASVYGMLVDSIPPGWSAWHSLKIRTGKGEFGECDFIIADPEKGLVLFEVKGGLIEKKGGQWTQNGRSCKPPLQQVHHFRKGLLDVFEDRGLNAPPIGVAVVFPDMYASDLPTQGDLAGVVIQGRELQYLREIFQEMFRTALPKTITYSPSPGWPQFVHELWCECWPLEMNLSRKIREDKKRRFKLDSDQLAVLGSLPENKKAIVKGGAGSGKTFMALELAVKEREAGKTVLLLTYTDALAMELARRTEGTGVTVRAIGRLALEGLRRRGFKDEETYSPEFWDKVIRKAAAPRLLEKPDKWDLVIVDEGQDMGREEWKFIDKCLNENSGLWTFIDQGQAFWKERALPDAFREAAAVFILPRSYRCPPGIAALAEAYEGHGFEANAVGEAFKDRTIEVVAVPGTEHIQTAVGFEIKRLLADGFRPDEIAVISLRGLQYEDNIAHCGKLGDHAVVKATDPDMVNGIACDSFLRFKGLERTAVIVTDLDRLQDRYGVRMNIAVTRSVGVLRIVGEQESISRDELLSRFAGLRGAG